MTLKLNEINKVTSFVNFSVTSAAKLLKLSPSPITVFTAQTALITQIATTTNAISKQSSQAQLLNSEYDIDGSILAFTAKTNGFILALGSAATGTFIAGFTPILLTAAIAVTAGVVAALSNEDMRDIITDPELWEAFDKDGFAGLDQYLNARMGIDLGGFFEKILEGFLTGEILDFHNTPSEEVNTDFQSALDFVFRRDPLILDLDGDGIETTPADGSILFDHNADAQKTATGWIAPDDGLLVLDRNGNGTIDNGQELFGNNTVKANGELASNGFDALAELDANQDGVVDSNDADFNNLRVWRDLNQDGISQTNELFTLDQLNIKSISTASEKAEQNLGNNNQAIATGTFTYTDGTSSSAGSAASLDLATNNFYREFTESLTIPEALQHLPDLVGSGDVRDLKQAATLSTTLSDALEQYSQATTKAQQLSQLDGLLQAWADTADFKQLTGRIDEAKVIAEVTLKFGITKPTDGADLPFADDEGTGGSGGGVIIPSELYYDDSELKVGRFADRRNVEVLAKIQILEVFNNQAFFDFSTKEKDGDTEVFDIAIKSGNTGRKSTRSLGAVFGAGDIYITENDLTLSEQQMTFVEKSYDALKQSVYDSLLMQTRLAPFTDSIALDFTEGKFTLDFAPMEALMQQSIDADAVNALTDLIDFHRLTQGRLQQSGWRGTWSFMGEALRSLTITPDVQVFLDANKIAFLDDGELNLTGDTTSAILLGNELDNTLTSNANDGAILNGDTGNDTLYGSRGDDTLNGGSGNDTLYGNRGKDIMDGGAGNDTLYGGYASVTMRGGSGDDKLYASGNGNILEGGQGNDTLSSSNGYSKDIYLFNLGDGRDTITDDGNSDVQDVLRFGDGISATDLISSRNGADLILSHQNGNDQITIKSWFANSGGKYFIESFEFADNTAKVASDYTATFQTQIGTDGDDTLTGIVSGFSNTLSGGAGNDILKGGSADDTLNGGSGNDTLYGNRGKDIMDGGAGNDTLYGGYASVTMRGGSGDDKLYASGNGNILEGGQGNDTLSSSNGYSKDIYLFNLSDGRDTITDDGNSDVQDVLRFGDGISASDITGYISGLDLVLSHSNGTDQITIKNWYANSGRYQIELIEYTDDRVQTPADYTDPYAKKQGTEEGETLNGQDGYRNRLYGLSGDDTLNGKERNDELSGGNGDDQLNGGAGNDTLDGGSGNDTLNGGAGDDLLIGDQGNNIMSGGTGDDTLTGWGYESANTYLFNLGDGQDTIIDYSDSVYQDILRFGAGISVADITAHISGLDLVFSHSNGTDQITIKDWFDDSSRYQIERFEYADGTVKTPTDYANFYVERTGTEGVDELYGKQGYHNRLTGLAGNDTLHGKDQDDELIGGDGADILYGNNGNDLLEGGAGDDTLDGGNGDDILNGGAGDDDLFANEGNNIMSGGKGDDTLTGWGDESGNTYLFNLGDGKDTIIDYSDSVFQDTLRFGDGIKAEDITAHISGVDLVLSHSNGIDQVTIKDWYNDSSRYQIERFEYADGTVKTPADYAGFYVERLGTESADTLYGKQGYHNRLDGLAGDDTLHGKDRGDELSGGEGADILYGNGGDDLLDGGAGADTLDGGNGDDTLNGGAGNDMFYDDEGNNTFSGGKGNDILDSWGSHSADTYLFDSGDGRDVITDVGDSSYQDTLRFGAGISSEQLWFSQTGSDLAIDHIGSDDQVLIKEWFASDENQIEQISVENAVLHSNQVINLVNAMSAFNAPSGADGIVPQEVQDQLAPVLAASWT